MSSWERGRDGLARVVWEQTDTCLKVYAEDPSRVVQDANNERRIAQGGYSSRQLEELVQNAVDAARNGGERVEVLLSSDTLYVANDGDPFDEQGVRSVMASDISSKDDEKIGKFGIGFKSVLAISDSPKIFSRTVSFGFDAAWAKKTLVAEGYEVDHYPTMRLARTLDPESEGAGCDEHLRELMSWASTVIAVPLRVPAAVLAQRLDDFPAEFILFSRHIKQASLRNHVPAASGVKRPRERVITQREDAGETVVLGAGSSTTRWALARVDHRPSSGARAEAGHVADRSRVELQYALPIPPRSGKLGRFWAYFPTHFETTLTGLINAPWKMSDDRTGLLEGAFNTELLEVLPGLVGDAIQTLSGGPDAVAALDAMPARGLEPRNWADRHINGPVFDHLRQVPSLPDGRGTLKVPAQIKYVGDIKAEWLSDWAAVAGAPVDGWVHPDAYSNAERRLKIERLLRPQGIQSEAIEPVAGIDEWLEALVAEGTVEASAAAIRLAARIAEDCREITDAAKVYRAQAGLRAARIVRLENGDFKAPAKGQVFVRVDGDASTDADFVDPELAAQPEVREALRRLGVVVKDRSGDLRQLLARAKSREGTASPERIWREIWPVLRDIPIDTAVGILREDLGERLELLVRVQTAAGRWVLLGDAYLAGRLIPADGSRDRDLLIHPTFHREDEALLREVGAVDAPVWRYGKPRELWLARWEQVAADMFVNHVKAARIDPDFVVIEEGIAPPWPLGPIARMSDEGRAAATRHVVSHGLAGPRTVRHKSNASYGRIHVISPEVWFLRHHGRYQTSFGILPTTRVLRASDQVDRDVFPAVEVSEADAEALAIKPSPEDLAVEDWVALKQLADTWRSADDDDRRTNFYAWLPGRIDCESLVVRVGSQRQAVAVQNIGVTTDKSVFESMVEAQIPALLAPDDEDAQRFIDFWEMPRGADLLQEEIVVEPSGESSYLTDMFPPLKLHLDPSDSDLHLQPASRIVKMIATPRGQVARPIPARRDGDTVLITANNPAEQLSQISGLLALDLDRPAIARILQQMELAATNKRRNEIKRAANDDERLVAAVGTEALRRSVPAQALQFLDEETGGASQTQVAALARSVHGVSILKQLRPALDESGLEPPREWSGRRVTRQWVASLGFPSDWAGFPGSSRAAVEMIDGPAVLNPLHGYQEFVTDRIKSLLRGIGPDRGMVSLPTGAGKTRVTVEALVDAVRDGDIATDLPLVWLAQTDELCEQAAETWTYVWRAIGPQVPLRLGRLWAGNEVPEEPGSFQLIIATVDKLNSVRTRASEEYAWLCEPSVVVIDEAHTSISPSYTQVLDWLGRSGRIKRRETRKPLIGLTATPFRGTSVEETERLVGRYGENRLDRGAFLKEDPYEELQDMGVLAQVKHQTLGGTDVKLTASDEAEIEKMRRLPSAVTERLGSDLARTLRVVDSIAALPDDWTVLAFAPSVENARVLAALLSHRGVAAFSVSADTEVAARRHYIEEFKAGRIRVLTNFNVLTQGFDAPRVQAVYVARPTFSPNVYQQMIGRGLRGPKNGGSDEVLIVNVEDNFAKYGDLLAFREFEYLWNKR